jgi:hypothetical protein
MSRRAIELTVGMLLVAVSAVAGNDYGNTAEKSEKSDKHVKVSLVSEDGSTVNGFVQITPLKKGETNVNVVAKGLSPETTYSVNYDDGDDCGADAERLGTFKSNKEGNGTLQLKIKDDVENVGSVSVRGGSDFSDVLACAVVSDSNSDSK